MFGPLWPLAISLMGILGIWMLPVASRSWRDRYRFDPEWTEDRFDRMEAVQRLILWGMVVLGALGFVVSLWPE